MSKLPQCLVDHNCRGCPIDFDKSSENSIVCRDLGNMVLDLIRKLVVQNDELKMYEEAFNNLGITYTYVLNKLCVGELSDKDIDKIDTDAKTYSDELSTRIDKLNAAVNEAVPTKVQRCGTCILANREEVYCPRTNTNIKPQVMCTKTGMFHYVDDICDCTTTITAN